MKKLQYIAELDGQAVREGYRTTHRPLTHAVVGVFADNSKPYVLGWYTDEFTAHAEAADNWRPYPGYRKVVVVPVKGYPLAAGALT